jgi:hypothetical protein
MNVLARNSPLLLGRRRVARPESPLRPAVPHTADSPRMICLLRRNHRSLPSFLLPDKERRWDLERECIYGNHDLPICTRNMRLSPLIWIPLHTCNVSRCARLALGQCSCRRGPPPWRAISLLLAVHQVDRRKCRATQHHCTPIFIHTLVWMYRYIRI